jgi:hypothetical protein
VKQFDQYEFAGVLVPGVAAVFGVAILFPQALELGPVAELSVGGLGLFVVLAYVAGHLVQAVGNGIENLWWKAWGGMPSDWVRTAPGSLLAPVQIDLLTRSARERLGLPDLDITSLSAPQWYAVTRQIYAEVARAGQAARVDIFNSNYGLNRGLAAALILVTAAAAVASPTSSGIAAASAIAAGIALYRMHRFGRHYARELFVQFLQLPPKEAVKGGPGG